MKEFKQGIKRRVVITAVATVLLALGLIVSGVSPPIARSLAWFGDHCIYHHQQRDRNLFANQGCSETAKRLGHDDQPARPALPQCADNGVRILGQASRIIGRRKRDSYRFMSTLSQSRLDQMPIPRTAASTRYQDE
jgi:hypothetical protein